MRLLKFYFSGCLAISWFTSVGRSEITDADLNRLGTELTPLGGEKAANADGSIPTWDGGITTPPADYKPGDHHPDPYANDAPLATITAANLGTYEGKLTAGEIALLKAYSDYKLVLYPTHRSAAAP